MPIKTKTKKKDKVAPKVSEKKVRSFEVLVFPQPFSVKVLAEDAREAMEKGMTAFEERNPQGVASGINVQQK